MKKEEVRGIAEIMLSWSNGSSIEWRLIGSTDDWTEIKEPCWDFTKYEYRVKPGYRPYNGMREVLEDIKIHGPYVITDGMVHAEFIQEICDDCVWVNSSKGYNWLDALETFTWADTKEPFGRMTN